MNKYQEALVTGVPKPNVPLYFCVILKNRQTAVINSNLVDSVGTPIQYGDIIDIQISEPGNAVIRYRIVEREPFKCDSGKFLMQCEVNYTRKEPIKVVNDKIGEIYDQRFLIRDKPLGKYQVQFVVRKHPTRKDYSIFDIFNVIEPTLPPSLYPASIQRHQALRNISTTSSLSTPSVHSNTSTPKPTQFRHRSISRSSDEDLKEIRVPGIVVQKSDWKVMNAKTCRLIYVWTKGCDAGKDGVVREIDNGNTSDFKIGDFVVFTVRMSEYDKIKEKESFRIDIDKMEKNPDVFQLDVSNDDKGNLLVTRKTVRIDSGHIPKNNYNFADLGLVEDRMGHLKPGVLYKSIVFRKCLNRKETCAWCVEEVEVLNSSQKMASDIGQGIGTFPGYVDNVRNIMVENERRSGFSEFLMKQKPSGPHIIREQDNDDKQKLKEEHERQCREMKKQKPTGAEIDRAISDICNNPQLKQLLQAHDPAALQVLEAYIRQ